MDDLIDMEDDSYKVGKGRPPISTRFPPNTSGNPRGRPPGKKRAAGLPREWLLGRQVSVIHEGVETLMSSEKAFLLKMLSMGLATPHGMGLEILKAFEASPAFEARKERRPDIVMSTYPEDGNLKDVVERWRIAQVLDPYISGPPGFNCGKKARLVLQPWVVQAALDRLGDRRLSLDEQKTVVAAMKSPRKVRWPSWWIAGTEIAD